MAEPIDCFIADLVTPDSFAVYEVDPAHKAYAAVGGRIVELDRRLDGTIIAPLMMMDDAEMEDMAWSLLLRCVNRHVADEAEAMSTFIKMDMLLWDYVEHGGLTLAVTYPWQFARRPVKDGLQGLFVFNPDCVILVGR